MLKERKATHNNLQRFFDCLIVLSSWMLAYFIRFHYLPGGQPGLALLFAKLSVVLALLTFWVFQKNGLYDSHRLNSKFSEILTVLKTNSFSVFMFVIYLYFLQQDKVSRITLLIYYTLSTFLLILARIIVRNFLRKLRLKGKNLRHVLLIGDGQQLYNYVKSIQRFKDSGFHFIGWIDSNDLGKDLNIQELKISPKEAIEMHSPDSVVIGYNGTNGEKVNSFLKENYNNVFPIQVLPDLSYSMIGYQIEDFAGVPLLTLNHPHFSTFDAFGKRLVDVLGSAIGIFLLSPLYFLISLLVKLSSPGPIFFKQERVGLDGELFNMWKFRSMRVAEDQESDTTWGSKDNPRKTKIGEFIRKTSIDELPQLWNVLVGNMSLIGPRPERPFFVDKFKDEIPHYMLRHKMKAGITGWAQVNGWRGDTSIKIRIEHDIYYIKNWSLWLDIKIIFLTFWKGFINKNAY